MFPPYLEDRLVHSNGVLVFPSEIAAAFWRRRILSATARSAIRADRVLSWDAFKERYFGRRQRLRPVNNLQRTIFALDFLESHTAVPELRLVVPPAYAHESRRFLTNVRAVLPVLPRLQAVCEQIPDLSADLAVIRRRYDEFLSESGCFEPSWLGVGAPDVIRRHTIVFPELIEDFTEFASPLESSALVDFITLNGLSADDGTVLRRFRDSRREIDAVFDQLETLLDSGVPASDVAITIPRMHEVQEFLVQESERRQVPLSLRSGAALSEYPPGRLFAGLAGCVHTRFSLSSLKSLLLDRGLPWKDRRANELLIRFGVDTGCIASGRRDVWRAAFKFASNRLVSEELASRRDELGAYFGRLSAGIKALVGAKSFEDVKARLYAFSAGFLDTDGWGVGSERVFQRCIDLLDDLGVAAAGRRIADPYGLYLTALSEKVYVEKNDDGGGIAVYPYRVSAGINPPYHFIMNASRRATTVQIDEFPFLSDPIREKLALPVSDASDAFWTAYNHSGGSVWASFADLTPGGPQLAPGCFIESASVVDAESSPVSPYRQERLYWSGEEPDVARVYPTQIAGLDHAEQAAYTARGDDLTERVIGDPALTTYLESRQAEHDDVHALRISPTHLESFLACPFGYLANRVLGLEETSWQAEIERALDLGSFYHRVLEVFFGGLKERSEPLSADALTEYESALRSCVEREAAGWAMRETALHPVVLGARLHAITGDILDLVRRQVEERAGWIVVATEEWYATLTTEGIRLYGKIDRIDRNPATGGHLLLDYKKSGIPKKGDITGTTGRGDPVQPTSYQVPFYLLLAEANGVDVDEAGYESVERRAYTPVFGESGYFGEDERDEVLNRLRRAVGRMAERVRAGDYRCDEVTCDGCAFRAFCRRKFVVQ